MRRFADIIAGFLWPGVCAVRGCSRTPDRPGRHICSRCFAALPYYDLPGDGRTAFALHHSGGADEMIVDFKFRGATWLLDDFADLLEGAVRARLEADAVDVVIPVPLHPVRFLRRGYNQSGLLARALAERIGRRFDAASLQRIRNTRHQSRLAGAGAREENVKGAFKTVRPYMVRGRTVLLVDDVATTCATFDACADALRAAGAWRIWYAAVFKRGDEP